MKLFYSAAGAGDAATACALFTTNRVVLGQRADRVAPGILLGAPSGTAPSLKSTCVEKVGDVSRATPDPLKQASTTLTVKTVRRSPTKARLEITIPGSQLNPWAVDLVKIGDGWKIESANTKSY